MKKCKKIEIEKYLKLTYYQKICLLKIKRKLNDKGISINRIEYDEVLDKMKYFEKIIILEKIEYDPFFGYKGSPTELIENQIFQMKWIMHIQHIMTSFHNQE